MISDYTKDTIFESVEIARVITEAAKRVAEKHNHKPLTILAEVAATSIVFLLANLPEDDDIDEVRESIIKKIKEF